MNEWARREEEHARRQEEERRRRQEEERAYQAHERTLEQRRQDRRENQKEFEQQVEHALQQRARTREMFAESDRRSQDMQQAVQNRNNIAIGRSTPRSAGQGGILAIIGASLVGLWVIGWALDNVQASADNKNIIACIFGVVAGIIAFRVFRSKVFKQGLQFLFGAAIIIFILYALGNS